MQSRGQAELVIYNDRNSTNASETATSGTARKVSLSADLAEMHWIIYYIPPYNGHF